MLKSTILAIIFGLTACLQPLEVFAQSNSLTEFFSEIRGAWTASPSDSTFISKLVYKKGEERFLLPVENVLTSMTGEDIYARYEGMYFYNPVEKSISFTTVTNSEVHTGTCRVEGDTLFHEATVSGNSNVKSYASAIVKKEDGTLHYYANYSESDTIPELKLTNPLIYRRE